MTFLSRVTPAVPSLQNKQDITEAHFQSTNSYLIDPLQLQSLHNSPSALHNGIGIPDVAPTDASFGSSLSSLREPLRFSFKGYTIWLEFEEYSGDFTEAIEHSAKELGVPPIPQPHVTAIYGMDHLSENEIQRKFDEVKKVIKSWPDLKPRGIVADVELDGVDGGLMDMVWSEVTFCTSSEHERHLDTLHDIFEYSHHRPSRWRPHASLTYDNPENSPLSLSYTAGLVAERPSLLAHTRRVVGMSLWKTIGKMNEWTCLDRLVFDR
mmetsp:Transcript_28717/g.34988  ORF Transcript_28717/g.34988 Transcript_28717/m.34988 type:complete len:266 (+) Transcript_28717:295-1092(+)|eukprot:CAMPEP_0172481760 /NCGR_PEP_ID=MMETSP1066-20121228/7852_1 /TAXON_ID=671091 /ORGANISM="Coscinodiscus wailesii, Strain CCMP2513" /LENGTH=265 /DNA_ID=CAMNT_0013244343 /DNA_START=290 /DNA_END=1087 /DNA_ORIENTATION=+